MAEQEPPTYINGSGWLFAFSTRRRSNAWSTRRVHSVALRNPSTVLEAQFAQGAAHPERALVRFIGSEFEPREQIGKFVVMARRGG